jgi:hypothetical protein
LGGSGLKDTIPISHTSIGLRHINTLNNSNIFETNFNGCIRYFEVKYGEKYLLLDDKTKGLNYIVNIYEDSPVTSIKKIKNKDIVSIINKNCFINTDLTQCIDKIKELNIILQAKCPNLNMTFNYIFNTMPPNNKFVVFDTYELEQFILCLNDENGGCISSILLKISNNSILFDSKTNPEYESMKYNKLLRSVLIIISQYITTLDGNKINTIVSFVINPASAYIMINMFGAISNEDFQNYITDHNISDISFSVMLNYYKYLKENKQSNNMFLTIHITPEILEKSNNLFLDTITIIICKK